MCKVTKYVVKHPKVSAVISVEQVDSTYLPRYSRDEIYADSWEKAHGFLRQHAMERVIVANAEMNRAIQLLSDVNDMSEPIIPE